MTKTFDAMAAQGDVLFRRIDKLPEDAQEVKTCGGRYVLSHSETGHAHIIREQPDVQFFTAANDNMRAYLVVHNDGPLAEHMRGFDTHESISFKKGIYEIRRQQEYSPEGWRVALD